MSKSPKLRKKKKSSATTGDTTEKSTAATQFRDPIPPIWIPPPVDLGMKLLEAVQYHPLDERDLFGLKISARVLKYLSPGEIRDLFEVFSEFDRDSIGVLKPLELFYAMRTLGFRFTKKDAEEFVAQETQFNNAKGIDVNQFLELIIDKQHAAKDNYEELCTAFKLFDFEKTGYLTLDNLRQACIEAELNLTDSELKEMLKEADTNGDELIDVNEFIGVMLKTNLYS